MSTVLVSPFFHPEPISTGRYNTVLAQAMVRRGAAVEVLTSHPLYPSWQPTRSSAQLEGMVIHRGGGWLRYPRNALLRRLLLETWYALHAGTRLFALRRRAARVVVVFPPSLVGATLRLVLPRRCRIVGIVHDLQGIHVNRKATGAGRLLAGLIHRVERRAFSACDRLLFLSHSMAEQAITGYGLDRSRCAVHYPFLTLTPPNGTANTALAGILPEGHGHVVYSGALGDKQEPDRLVALMREIARRHPSLRCHIFSAGPHFERLRSAAADARDATVTFHGLVSEAALEELYARSMVHLLPQSAGTSEGSLPSKLPNLLSAGVPVFAICDAHSEIVRLLLQAGEGAGEHADSFGAADLHQRFDSLLESANAESHSARARRVAPFVQRLFGAEAVVTEILDS
jgi:colanic acid biosynthesis glycosyl transferase WcaI